MAAPVPGSRAVICDAATAAIIGYVTLSAAQVERAFLPKPQQRNKSDPVPAHSMADGDFRICRSSLTAQ